MLSKLLVCLTGMPGAGKSTIAEGLESKGYEIINLGNAVRDEAKNRNLEASRENLGKLMLELREKNGPGAIAELVKSKIKSSTANVLLIDGVRSNDEIQVLRKFGTVKLLAIEDFIFDSTNSAIAPGPFFSLSSNINFPRFSLLASRFLFLASSRTAFPKLIIS